MKLKYISWIPAVVIMCIIFIFSSKTAVESDGTSLPIAQSIVSVYENISGEIEDVNIKNEILSEVDHIVRKMAHATEYALLAFSVSFHLWACGLKSRKMFIIAIVVSALYAATDEFHQLFVVGRSCQIKDVGIDSGGAILGATFYCILTAIIERLKRKQKVI